MAALRTEVPAPREPWPAHLLAFTAAALAVLALPRLPDVRFLILAALPAFAPWRRRALYATAALGALLTAWQAQRALDARWPLEASGAERAVAGRVISLPESQLAPPDEGGAPRRDWRFLFRPDDPALPPRIRVAWYRADAEVKAGQCWRLTLRLRAPHGDVNPGGFDYEAWLFRQGIAATATVRAAEPCARRGGLWLLRARQALVDRLQAWLPQHPGLGLVLGLTVGDRGLLTERDWDAFRITGTSHLMAIAGLHVGMVTAAAYFLLRWLWVLWPSLTLRLPAQKAALVGSAATATAYALLSGFEPPAQRALIMLLLGYAALWFERPALVPRALMLAWFAIVAADPLALLSPGLWLSFCAVGAILYAVSGRLGSGGRLLELLRLQALLSLALLPLTFFFFQGGGWLGPLANAMVVPLFTLLLPALLLAVVLAALAPALGLPVLSAVAWAIYAVRAALGWAAAHAPGAWIAASPQPAALLLALLGVIALMAPRGLPLKTFAALCFVPLFLPFASAPQSGFALTALDVGQGLSVVVRTAQHALLFDAGPAFGEDFDAGRSQVVPYLLAQGVRRLDLMIVSHADVDHRGGAPAVRRALTVDEELGALATRPCVGGDRWSWDGVDFEILNGPQDAADLPHPRNNGGCVLRVAAGDHAALLPADIEAGAERRLLADQPQALRADVLLAPHHGSRTSSTEAFVRAVAPRVVIYPAGWQNRFDFPRAPVVARYAALGAEQHMTGLEGAVTVRVDQSGILALGSERRLHPRLWRQPAQPVPGAPQSRVGLGASP